MLGFKSYIRTTVGKKTVVALSGLVMAGFTLVHMAGNLLIPVGAEAYNHYSHGITSNLPLLYTVETVLVLAFVFHVYFAVTLSFSNRSAKSGKYYVYGKEKGTTYAARSMIYSGLLLFVFIILHLITFKYGPYYVVEYGGVEMRDLHRLIAEKFHEPLYVTWYVLALLVLGLHLSHGLKGAIQSLGLASSLNPSLVLAARVFAVLVAGGFILPPLYVMFLMGGP